MCGLCGLGAAHEAFQYNQYETWPGLLGQLIGAEKEPTPTPDQDPTGFSPFFDIPSGTGTNVFLPVGGRINAEISVSGDTDWFAMTFEQGKTYQISLKALPFFGLGDPQLYLFDNFGNLLTVDDNSGEGLDSLLTVTATRTGTYFIGATGFGGGLSTTGSYEITLAQVNFAADTVGQTPNSAGTVAVGGSVNGTIDFGTDEDWYEITVQKGKTYAVFLDSAILSFAPLADPKLEVLDRNQNSVAFNDDNGITKNAALTFTADYNGKYYIRAFGGPANTGDFTLTVQDFTPPEPPSPLDALDWGVKLDDAHVTYYFAAQGETFAEETTDTPWSNYEKQQAASALAEYSKFSLLTFAEVGSAAQADFILTKNFLDSDNTGRMIPPDPAFEGIQGVGWFNTSPTYWSDDAGGLLSRGAYGYSNFIHEYGHGLGLSHPHDNALGASEVMAGVTNSNDRGDFGLNSEPFTVMSYIEGWTGGPPTDSNNQLYGYARTPMAFDIAVIQEKYGVNTNFNGGDNVYSLVNTNGRGTGYEAIWDTGGHDRIVHTGSMGATIDLREATLKTEAGGGGFVSFATGIHGGLTIANGVRIEEAFGGGANDTLIGSRFANKLNGNKGNDVMLGGKGADRYIVDSAGDVVTEFANSGTDMVITNAISLDLADYAHVEHLRLGGDKNLDLTGSAEDNSLIANSGKNTIKGLAGDDRISGGKGNDRLFGNDGRDILRGQNGIDNIRGGGGGDKIEGGRQNDKLTGQSGNDDFVFRGRIDMDIITDFELGRDELHFSQDLWTGTLTKAQVVNQFATIRGGDVVFEFEPGQGVRLDGISSKAGLVDDIVFI